jgi:hypothetical protein
MKKREKIVREKREEKKKKSWADFRSKLVHNSPEK